MLQAIQASSMSVAMLNRFTPGTSEVILSAIIDITAGFFNIGKNMNPTQVGQTVELILSDPIAKNLKPEDFKVMFDNGKKGVYGKAYDRLDGQVIFEWINAYASERMALCEQLNINEHGKKKKADNLIHPEVVEMYKKMLPEIKEIEKTKPAERPKPLKSERDLKIQELFMEFTKMNGEEVKGKKYVRVEGVDRPLDEVEYVELKIKTWDNGK